MKIKENLFQKKKKSQVKCDSDMIRSTGGCYSGWGSDWMCFWVGGVTTDLTFLFTLHRR